MKQTLLGLLLMATAMVANAGCHDAVVLVHGNTATPASWDNTLSALLAAGYSRSEIFLPDWGSKTCAACNNHDGSEEVPVRQAMTAALAQSCTGKIDVIGHSMGATLAAQQIVKLGIRGQVDTFVGIAGAFRGLYSCGIYPYNVWNSTCGTYGLSVSSPFLNDLYGNVFADKVYSIKSYMDEVVCSTGTCLVYGIHSSSIWYEDASYTFALGHFGLQSQTADLQVQLIQ